MTNGGSCSGSAERKLAVDSRCLLRHKPFEDVNHVLHLRNIFPGKVCVQALPAFVMVDVESLSSAGHLSEPGLTVSLPPVHDHACEMTVVSVITATGSCDSLDDVGRRSPLIFRGLVQVAVHEILPSALRELSGQIQMILYGFCRHMFLFSSYDLRK